MHNRTVRNAVWIIGSKIVKSFVSVVITMLTARFLGPSNYGIINYAASIVAFVTPVMQLGFNATLVREIVSKPEEEGTVLGTALTMSFISSVFCIIGITAFVIVANPGDLTTVVVCILYSLLLVFQSLEMIQYWFQAKLLSKYTALVMLCSYIIVSCYKVVLLITGKSIYWYAVSQTIDFAVIAVALFFIYRKIGIQKLRFSKSLVRPMINTSRYYILSGLMVTVFAQTDKIMLKAMIGSSAVGIYSAAFTCASITSFVFVAIIDSARPAIFEKAKLGAEQFQEGIRLLYTIIIYFALAQCVVITLFSSLIVKILYGSEYITAIPALRIVVWYTLFSFLGSIRNIWILQYGKQGYLWKINLSGALANVLLNLVWIPLWGINGAAAASLFTQIFTNVIVGWIVKPIRPNNYIMLQALNPKSLLQLLKNDF